MINKNRSRLKAETPKGFRDYFGNEVIRRNKMLRTIEDVYFRYGFEPLETSAIETVEALGKFLPDIERPNEGIFCWEEGDDWLALRYDLTAPLARAYSQYRNKLPTPYRRYSIGPVWRNEKPGPGRFRQFYQCDADTVGAGSPAADAEICAMLIDTLEEVGISHGDYSIKINNRKILNGVMETIGLNDPNFHDEILRTIDKFNRIGLTGVYELLTEGRLDESGTYIKGVGLSDDQASRVINFLSVSASESDGIIDALRAIVGKSEIGLNGVTELEQITHLLAAQHYTSDQIQIDPTVVRGLGYYTGAVYEAELTFEITDDKGCHRQFGSVAGGGRYDNLIKRFTGQQISATGISIGVDRLLAALATKQQQTTDMMGPVLVTVMDRERMADYQTIVTELRNNNIRAEIYLGNPKSFGNQLKYADRRNAPLAIIEGAEEKVKGTVQVKDLILGAKIAETATLDEWRERPAQVEVKRQDLVTHVRTLLNRE